MLQAVLPLRPAGGGPEDDFMADESNRPNSSKPGGPPTGNRPSVTGGGMGFRRSLMGWFILAAAAVLVIIVINHQADQFQKVDYSVFWEQLAPREEGALGNVRKLTINGSDIRGEFRIEYKDPNGPPVKKFKTQIPSGMASDYEFLKDIREAGGGTVVAVENTSGWVVYLVPLIPWILIFAFIWFFLIRQL